VNTEVKPSLVSRTTGLVGGIIVIVAITIAGAWWLLKTDYETLLSETNPESRAEMLAMLMQWQIPYKLDEATGAVLVPAEQVSQTRARLGGLGLPATQTVGLEVFGQGDYGMSEFAQRINYQRGLEGELAKTIRTFEEIKSARVHLTLAKNSLFENRKEAAKASVAVQLKPERALTQQQISGIQQLVAGAITGLDPEQVVVLNEQGKPLVSGDASESDRWSNMRVAEREYEERARQLIASIVPEATINISVKLQFNFDRVKSIRETLIPLDDGTGFLVKKREQTAIGESPNADSSTNVQNNTSAETEYVYGKERAEIEHPSGVITRINIGVVIGKPLPQDTVNAIDKIIRSGLGLSAERGDSIAIVSAQQKSVLVPDVVEGITLGNEATVATPKIVSEETSVPVNPLLQFIGVYWLAIIGCIVFILALIALHLLRRPAVVAPQKLTEREREQLLIELRSWLAQEQNEVK
jgi:flagellar M-ring protein FliF